MTSLDEQLRDAAWSGNLAKVQRLVGQGANVHATNNYCTTPLHFACDSGQFSVVQYLITQAGANVHATSKSGRTPLHFACGRSQLSVVQYLVEQADACTDVRDEDGETPLDVAKKFKRDNVVQYLEARATRRKATNKQTGTTAVVTTTTSPKHATSKFLTLLCDTGRRENLRDMVDVHDYCRELAKVVVNLPELRIFYTVLRAAVRQDILSMERATQTLELVLTKVAQTCIVNEDSWVFFQIIINKCYSEDGWLNEETYLRFCDKSLMKRVQHADFILEMNDLIRYNAARINQLQANLEHVVQNVQSLEKHVQLLQKNIETVDKNVRQVQHGVGDLKHGLRVKARLDGIVDMVTGVLGSLTFGIGSAIASVVKPIFLKVVDFSDTLHLTKVIRAEIRDAEQCNLMIKSLQQGITAAKDGIDFEGLANLAGETITGNFTDKKLDEALRTDTPIFPLCIVGYAATMVTTVSVTPMGAPSATSGAIAGSPSGTQAGDAPASTSSSALVFPDAVFDEFHADHVDLEFHCAVKYGQKGVVEELIQELGSMSINEKDNEGRTAMDLAAKTGQLELIKTLKEAGGKFSGPRGRMVALAQQRSAKATEYLKQVNEALVG